MKFIFFGTSRFSVIILDTLHKRGLLPALIVATPDKPQGKKLTLTPPPSKIWAEAHGIPVYQPDSLKGAAVEEKVKETGADVAVVASYGKIIPESVISLFPKGMLNVHPSLLPNLRGASPLQSALLGDMKHTGVSIMLLDAEMDHGPLVAQKEITVQNWPLHYENLETLLGDEGGNLLANILPDWVADKIEAIPQDHSLATYTKKIEKSDGEVQLAGDPYKNFLKIRAFSEWPGTFFFADRKGTKIRVIVKDAEFKDGKLELKRVLPEGGKEMAYEDFLRGL